MTARPLAGTVALVTGAARPRSIGRATALRLAIEGADVACLDIGRPYDAAPAHRTASACDLEEVVARINTMGRRAVAVQADVSQAELVEAAVEAEAEAHKATIEAVQEVEANAAVESAYETTAEAAHKAVETTHGAVDAMHKKSQASLSAAVESAYETEKSKQR